MSFQPFISAPLGARIDQAELLIVFATHNGAGWIERTLEGYARQLPAPPWALVVIDNGSTDETAEVLTRYQGVLPLLVLNEERPGKNVALNRALTLLGDTNCNFVFTDDDAVPEPDFVERWSDTLARQCDHSLFGGTVIPYFDGLDHRIPNRYEAFHAEIYARNIRPEGAIEPQWIFGPNMAVSGAVIRAGHRFNEEIGPSSADPSYPMGSETEFCVRVAQEAGVSAWFAVLPRVLHIVRDSQATEQFVLQRAFRHGRGCAQITKPGTTSRWVKLKSDLRLALLRLVALTGSARAKWNKAWLEGYRSGVRRDRGA